MARVTRRGLDQDSGASNGDKEGFSSKMAFSFLASGFESSFQGIFLYQGFQFVLVLRFSFFGLHRDHV